MLVAALLEMKSRRLLDAGSPFVDELAELDERGGRRGAARRRCCASPASKAPPAGSARLFADNAGRLYRTAPVPERFLRTAQTGQALPAAALSRALGVLLAEPPAPDVRHITDIAVTLVAELRRLRDLLAADESFTFSAVAPRDRLEKAVTFFALLELHNRGEVSLRQPRPFAEITVTRAAPRPPASAPADDALAAVGVGCSTNAR